MRQKTVAFERGASTFPDVYFSFGTAVVQFFFLDLASLKYTGDN